MFKRADDRRTDDFFGFNAAVQKHGNFIYQTGIMQKCIVQNEAPQLIPQKQHNMQTNLEDV
jgi:hypothetical protein